MEHEIRQNFRREFGGRVDEVYVGGRRVGMVYKDPKLEEWIAYSQGGHGADSREEALRAVLQHAEANPDYELR